MSIILARFFKRPNQNDHKEGNHVDINRATTPRIRPTTSRVKTSAWEAVTTSSTWTAIIASSTSTIMIESSTSTITIESSTWTTMIADFTSTTLIASSMSTTVIPTSTTFTALATTNLITLSSPASTPTFSSTSSDGSDQSQRQIPSPINPSPSLANSQNMSLGVKVGIAFGAILIVLLVSLCIFLWRRRVQQAATSNTAMVSQPDNGGLQRDVSPENWTFVTNTKPELAGTPHPVEVPDMEPKHMMNEDNNGHLAMAELEAYRNDNTKSYDGGLLGIAELEGDGHVYAVEADSTPLIAAVSPSNLLIKHEILSSPKQFPTCLARQRSVPLSTSTSTSPTPVQNNMSRIEEQELFHLKEQIEAIRLEKEKLTLMQTLEAREMELSEEIVKRELKANKKTQGDLK